MSPHRILAVDDDPDLLHLIKLSLESVGHDVLTAIDGPSALAVLDQHDVDLLVCDVMMPGMSGYEVVTRVRATWPARPVLMVSALATDRDLRRAREAGADAYLTKPFSLRSLIVQVGQLVDPVVAPVVAPLGSST